MRESQRLNISGPETGLLVRPPPIECGAGDPDNPRALLVLGQQAAWAEKNVGSLIDVAVNVDVDIDDALDLPRVSYCTWEWNPLAFFVIFA